MTTRRLFILTAVAALAAAAFGLWHSQANQQVDAAQYNRLRAQEVLRKVCPVSRAPEQVRSIGAALTANERARTLIWAGPALLYASDPALTAPAPLLTGPQRAEPGWTGWAEVDLPCGLSVQRFQKTGRTK
ncbi:hypothetical protein GJ700_05810 [Duganella sp. FT92W]|uniref:Uncharacterized protein n=1 Tax=Pseudoduganella rivuli TaxID=2666085 RepID=A0A7X2LSY2_9BURK|nr:hypothetical protein [Pseudoduganella rivuli]MRV71234.1 hypothetical protein [Pseudoduganella rivuli]